MFKLLTIACNFPEGFRLIFGQAVEVSTLRAGPLLGRELSAGGKRILFIEGVISDDELLSISIQISKQSIKIADWEIDIGKTIKRDEVILGPNNFTDINGGTSLHPDMHFTYRLEEWWAEDNKTFRAWWETRNFMEIGQAIAKETGLELQYSADRVGNFMTFRKLSQWIIDSSPNFDKTSRWVRPLYNGDMTSSIDLLLSYRILSGQESVKEEVILIDQRGIEIPIHRTYNQISLSLFNKDSGELLACYTADLFTGLQVTTSFSKNAPIKPVGTDGKEREIKWNTLDARSRQGSKEPWMGGAQLRRHTNRLLQESYRVSLFKRGERDEMLKAIRNIVQNHTREFFYICDPYVDADVVKDFLPELHPSINCKILCGMRYEPKNKGKKKKIKPIKNELDGLRKSPWDKSIECKFRYRKEDDNIRAYYHDRFLITRNAAWVLSFSLNWDGKKDGCLVRLLDPDRLRWMFEDEWDQGPSSETFYEEII